MKSLTATGFLLRFIFALLLVLCTYNPSEYSYFHWLSANLSTLTPYIAIAGLVLIIGWTIYLRSTLRSLGVIGIILASLFFACLIWLLIFWGVLAVNNVPAMAWAIEVLLAALLAVGMSWSHIRRAMSGQADMDDVDDN